MKAHRPTDPARPDQTADADADTGAPEDDDSDDFADTPDGGKAAAECGTSANRTDPAMCLSDQQQDAVAAVKRWLANRGTPQWPQVFRLFGYAGSGKTTITRHIAAALNQRTLFAAYTGKAASVMRAAGCDGATTLHSLIYHPQEDEKGRVQFVLNPESAAACADLIVIDECSLVGKELGRDLVSFGAPILVLGDPAQLPALEGAGYFTTAAPDVMLTEIFRQGASNPILELATDAREGRPLKRGYYGKSRVIGYDELSDESLLNADQILVGRNTTRERVNTRVREFLGRDDSLPVAGDKLCCLKNHHKRGLLNGSLWRVRAVTPKDDGWLRLSLAADDDPAQKLDVRVHEAFFRGGDAALTPAQKRRSEAFTYGYALTVHKAQGSQWDNIIILDEADVFPNARRAWRYTALTRAVTRLTLVH